MKKNIIYNNGFVLQFPFFFMPIIVTALAFQESPLISILLGVIVSILVFILNGIEIDMDKKRYRNYFVAVNKKGFFTRE